MTEKAHNLSEKLRTDDVLIEESISFSDLLLSESTLNGLEASGFKKPSPIQRKAIPLGKIGFDLIVQAKSGTGKTCVFTVIALEMIKPDLKSLQVLILSPTREISVQIRDVISAVGRGVKDLKVEAFIGGIPVDSDKKKLENCQIAVGAPGRVKHLISEGMMKLDKVRLFVLDEADKLMEGNFRKDINFVYLKLPEVKQIVAASATFPKALEDFVIRYMTNPMRVNLGKDVFLLGIRQFVSVVPSHLSVFVQMKNKVTELLRILSSVSFKQCLIFSNYQSRAESICNELNKEGWPAVYISGSQNQNMRLQVMSSLKEFKCRVLLSTDLTSRGIDAENVDLIINLDLPFDGPTYMHRIGRAGRYGSQGLAITIVQDGLELEQFRKMMNGIGGANFNVLLFPKNKINFNIWEAPNDIFEKVFSIEGEYAYLRIREKGRFNEEINEEKSNNEKSEPKETLSEQKKKNVKVEEEKAFENIFSYELLENREVKLTGYKNLKERVLDLENKKFENNPINQVFERREFPPEVTSCVLYLEKQSWAKYNKLLDEKKFLTTNKNETQSNLSVVSSEVESEDEADVEVFESSNSSSSSSSSETEDENEDCDDCDFLKSDNVFDSYYLKQWFSMWYSQMYTVNCYVNYLKHFYYWKELLNKR